MKNKEAKKLLERKLCSNCRYYSEGDDAFGCPDSYRRLKNTTNQTDIPCELWHTDMLPAHAECSNCIHQLPQHVCHGFTYESGKVCLRWEDVINRDYMKGKRK